MAEDYVGNVNIFQTEAFSVSLPMSPPGPTPTTAKDSTAKKVSKKRRAPTLHLHSAVDLSTTTELASPKNVHKRVNTY